MKKIAKKDNNKETAKKVINWLTDRGVDVTAFALEKGAWTGRKLIKLVLFGLKELSKQGGKVVVEFKDFVGPMLPKSIQKVLRIKPESNDGEVTEVDDEIDEELI